MVPNLPAKGTVGYLLRGVDGEYFFRVYHKDHSFDDYELAHSDLMIQILDADSAFYFRSDGRILDHSPATLGYEPLPVIVEQRYKYQCPDCGANIGYLGRFFRFLKLPFSHTCEKK